MVARDKFAIVLQEVWHIWGIGRQFFPVCSSLRHKYVVAETARVSRILLECSSAISS